MARLLFSQYQKEQLPEVAERLKRDYYMVLYELTRDAAVHIKELLQDKVETSRKKYLEICAEFIESISQHVRFSVASLIPYVLDLAQKAEGGFNCNECGGQCPWEQESSIAELLRHHDQLRMLQLRLQHTGKPLYLESRQPLPWKILRNEIVILDTAISELCYLEESTLIPKILDAEQKIHAPVR